MCFAVLMKEKSEENVVQAYLSGIITHKAGSIVILSYNGTKYKNTTINEACEQLGIKILLSNLFHPQGQLKN